MVKKDKGDREKTKGKCFAVQYNDKFSFSITINN